MASVEHACIDVHTHVAGLFIMYMYNNIMLVGKKEPLLILVISDSTIIGLNITSQFLLIIYILEHACASLL